MLISIHDQTLRRVGFLSNENLHTPDFKNDKFHRYLAQGASTFDFTVNKRKNGVLQDYVKYLNEHAYFSFQYEGEDFLFDSVIVEEDDDEITFNCLTLNLEMRNEEVKKLENSTSHDIQWYFDKMGLINFAQIKLGKNEVSDYRRVIKYDSEDTKLSRLISVIQNFDAEFEFITKLKHDGTLDNITLNIYKKNDGGNVQGVGQNRNDVILIFEENVKGVSRKVDKSQIFNSLFVTGKNGLSWKNKAWSVKNAEGVEEFYKRAGESYAKAPLSAQMFPSQIQSTRGDIYTNKNKETEYTSVEAMWGYALSELRKNAYPLVEYEVLATSSVTVSDMGDGTPLHIGDTVRIQDMNFMDSNGDTGLFLSARVSELEISFTNPTQNKISFSNYVKLKSEVSDDLLDRMQSILEQNAPYRSEIRATHGIQFKNGTGSTDLSAHIFKGRNTVETIADSYSWFKDGVSMAETQTIRVTAASVPEKAVYSYEARINGAVVGGASVTITNVNDGRDGIGIKTTDITYSLSTRGTTAPTDGWTSSVPSLIKGKYLWTKTVWTYTDDSSERGYSVTYISKDGNNGEKGDAGEPGKVVQQSTEPTERFKSMLWQYTGDVPLKVTGITVQPNMTYVWNGSAWQIWFLNPANLQAVNAWITNAMIGNAAIDFAKIDSATIENLAAVNSVLGDVEAGSITNPFVIDAGDGHKYKGALTIGNSTISIHFETDENPANNSRLLLSPGNGVTLNVQDGEGGHSGASFNNNQLVITKGRDEYVLLNSKELKFSSDTKALNLPLSGVVSARVSYQRKNGVVYITGSGNWGNFPDNKSRTMGKLPEGFRPPATWGAGMNPQGGKRLMSVAIETNGDLKVTSDAAQNNVYAQFSMSYPVD
ncbi:phage tail protein [Lactococcus muris]|uniref:phage tail protein n=1 Tax=Lactococcus muris TaxID=2941330 RepID=UPI002301016A